MEIDRIREFIKRKHRYMTQGITETDEVMEKCFKPIVEQLRKLNMTFKQNYGDGDVKKEKEEIKEVMDIKEDGNLSTPTVMRRLFRTPQNEMTHGEKTHRNFESTNNKSLKKEIVFVESNYSLLSDNIRRRAPNIIQCSIFCGGKQCRYENPDCWDSTHTAIRGIYSHWVTDDIVAMARPCTEMIQKKKVIEQFKSVGVKSLINLQRPGEHANCGFQLENTGFTYDPAVFMENDIYYYNFGWEDYGDTSLNRILDMVKIVSFGLTEGKVAIHCHAGLGRTGVLIACYLVYQMKFRANKAIMFVRLKRPKSVQTRGQIQCVQEFEQMVWSQSITFPIKDQIKDKKIEDFTLSQYLDMQKILLHGSEARYFRYIPKIVFVICERLLKLANRHPVGSVKGLDELNHTVPTSSSFITADNNISFYQYIFAKRLFTNKRCRITHDDPNVPTTSKSGCCNETENIISPLENNGKISISTENDDEIYDGSKIYTVDDVIDAIIIDHETVSENIKKQIRQYQSDLNRQSSWKTLENESNLVVLTGLLFDWMEQLKTPILNTDHLTVIVLNYTRPQDCLRKFELITQYTVEYLFRFLAHLNPLRAEDTIEIMKRIIASLTQQSVVIKGNVIPSDKDFNRLRIGTYRVLVEFCCKFLDIINENIKKD
ncbi:uncharacterized protein LOC142324243 [Lycorma delicatula]|uniref:uncharacterized protein LOC142324243 n=1 Tax=Lycorma delicatula TaxID=130591 RepID=UPI003F512F7D